MYHPDFHHYAKLKLGNDQHRGSPLIDGFGCQGQNASQQGSEVLLWCSDRIIRCLHWEGGIIGSSSINKQVLDLRLSGCLLISCLCSFLLGNTKCGACGLQLIVQLVGVQTGP